MGLNCCDATMEVKIGNCGVKRRGSHRGSEKEGGDKLHFKPPENLMSYKRGCRRRNGIDDHVAQCRNMEIQVVLIRFQPLLLQKHHSECKNTTEVVFRALEL